VIICNLCSVGVFCGWNEFGVIRLKVGPSTKIEKWRGPPEIFIVFHVEKWGLRENERSLFDGYPDQEFEKGGQEKQGRKD